MDEILQQLEGSLGVSAGLLARSAAARAAVSGTSAEAVVRGWGGEEVAAVEPAAAESPTATGAADEPAAATEAVPEPAAPPPTPEAPVEEAEPAAVAEESADAEPAPEPDEPAETEPEAAGVLAGFPAWLSAALLLIPMVALAYVLIAPNGPGCGSSGQLAIDPEEGVAENCDGTEYGVETVSFFTIGEELYVSECAGCHEINGGGGTGPALAGGAVLATFPAESCSDHVRWVALGTTEWPDATYGANGTVPGAGAVNMPGFEDTLTPEDIAAVVIYERVQFGGQSLADAELDCGAEELELAGE